MFSKQAATTNGIGQRARLDDGWMGVRGVRRANEEAEMLRASAKPVRESKMKAGQE